MLYIVSPELVSPEGRRTARKVAKVALLTRARDRAGVAKRVSENRTSGLRIDQSMRL